MYFPTKEGFLLNGQYILRFEPVIHRDGSKSVMAVMVDGTSFEIGDLQDFTALDEAKRLMIGDAFVPFPRREC